MNMQSNKSQKRKSISYLSQLWGLTEQNAKLAQSYLMEETADDSLLSGAKQQVFAPFDWRERDEICTVLQQISAPEHTKSRAKILKLLWAIGKSTAVFAALFDQHDISNSDNIFRWHSEVLGLAAAVAMDAEYLAANPISYVQTKRPHQLAHTNPEALMEAQRLIADPKNSMAKGVLAGVLLGAWPKETKADTPLAQQVELLLDRVEAILASEDNILLFEEDVSQLKAYLRAGDPTAPVPATSFSNAWQLSTQECLSQSLISAFSSVECIAPAVLFGLRYDTRLACAMRILAGVNLCGVLWGILCFLPEDGRLDVLDALLPYIPGGVVTMFLFLVTDFYESSHKDTAQKVAQHFRAGAAEAVSYMDLDGYLRLGNLLPEVKHSRDKDWMDHLQVVIMSFMRKIFPENPQHTIVRDYLDSRGDLSDSAALLKPVRNEYRYILNIDKALVEYRRIAGWDAFACRCIVLFCLTCGGNGTSSSFPLNKEKKRNMDDFVRALIANGLPVRDCLTVLAIMYEVWYEEEGKKLLKAAVQEHFVTPEKIEGLSDAALNSTVTARIMAIEGLDKLSALPECAEKAHKSLVACAGDTSKQVQETLEELYISHPNWEKDYLAILGSKKAAQRSLAIRVLAGIGAEKYRSALEKALAREKNTKVMDQITAVLGTPTAAMGAGKQTPEELAAQVLKGGKKRKVQWLLEQSLPTVHRTDEARTAASEDQIAALFVSYADLGRMGRSDTAAAIAADLDGKDLETLACTVWERWIQAEAPGKMKWVLPFAAVFGGAAMTPELIRAINEWPQNARGAIACDAVAALSVSPDPAALMAVDSISRKFKFRQIKKAAAAVLERTAQELGITMEELADRIVPTLDFNLDGTRVFDYGPRKFTVRLTPSLKLVITTEAGKVLKSMPAPGKTDDMEKAPTAYNAYKNLKKQIKATIATQSARLEMALSSQRCWNSKAWRKLFVENPVMHQFAISLIWGVYENGKLKETFRYMEDGSFNTPDEEEYPFPDGANIGLVHPVELEEDTLSAWKQQLEDYEITQSIDQLSRPIYRLPAEQAQATALETAAGRIVHSLSLMSKLQSMGWYRGSVVDAGEFFTFYREDPSAGIGVELNFSGSFVGGDYEEITVFDAVFYQAGTVERGSGCYDAPKKENIFPLGQVPARYYSEVVWQLERATVSSTGTDPDWRNEKE